MVADFDETAHHLLATMRESSTNLMKAHDSRADPESAEMGVGVQISTARCETVSKAIGNRDPMKAVLLILITAVTPVLAIDAKNLRTSVLALDDHIPAIPPGMQTGESKSMGFVVRLLSVKEPVYVLLYDTILFELADSGGKKVNGAYVRQITTFPVRRDVSYIALTVHYYCENKEPKSFLSETEKEIAEYQRLLVRGPLVLGTIEFEVSSP
jgi:hypothetical protein